MKIAPLNTAIRNRVSELDRPHVSSLETPTRFFQRQSSLDKSIPVYLNFVDRYNLALWMKSKKI